MYRRSLLLATLSISCVLPSCGFEKQSIPLQQNSFKQKLLNDKANSEPFKISFLPSKSATRPIPDAYKSKATLLKDIKTLANLPKKDEFETKTEFENKIKNLTAPFRDNAYEIPISIEKFGEHITYDAETEKLTITFKIKASLLSQTWDSNYKHESVWLCHSPVQIEQENKKFGSYDAMNSFGATINALDMDEYNYGVAILEGKTQKFIFQLTRDNARKVLKKGSVVLKVQVDAEYPIQDENSLLVNLLIEKHEFKSATLKSPVRLDVFDYFLPVRLLHLNLRDENGKDIFQIDGQEIITSPLANDKALFDALLKSKNLAEDDYPDVFK